MANTLQLPKILAAVLPVLRQNAVMPRLVNTQYSLTPAERGQDITVQKSAAQTAANVTASNTPPANSDTTTTSVTVSLDKWKETRFHLTDQELTQINGNAAFVPGQMAEAIKALANAVDVDLLALYKDVGDYTGTAGTTPFASESQFQTDWIKGARKALQDGLVPMDPNNIAVVMDTAAEANVLSLAQFTDADRRGDQGGMINGEIGTKIGARWFANQNIVDHDGNAPASWLVNGAVSAGDTTITIDTGSNDPIAGDIFTAAGDTTEFVVKSYAANVITLGGEQETSGAPNAIADNTALTFIADHTPNIAFHRDAFTLATAPIADVAGSMGLGQMQTIIDPVTGLAIRLEVRRDYKQTTFDLDILYGVKTVRPELAHRILG